MYYVSFPTIRGYLHVGLEDRCIEYEVHFKCNAALFSLTAHVITPIWQEKTDAIYSVSNVLEFFLLAIFLQSEKQYFYLFNIGKYHEMGKVLKNISENAEKKQTLFFAHPHAPVLIKFILFNPE